MRATNWRAIAEMPGLWLSRGTGDIEGLDGFHFKPAADLGRIGGGIKIDGQVRPPVLSRQTERQFRAAGDATAIQNQRCVAIEHVLLGAKAVVGRIGLVEPVVIGNASILGQCVRADTSRRVERRRQSRRPAPRSTPVCPPEIIVIAMRDEG